MRSFTHTFSGYWTDGGSTVVPGSSKVIFIGADQSISSGTKTVRVALSADSISTLNGIYLAIGNSLTIMEAFDAGSSTITVSGAFINNGNFSAGSSSITVTGNGTDNGTFTAGTSTVTFSGVDSDILSDEVFYNLTLNSTGADRALDFGTAAIPVRVTVFNDFNITNGEVRIRPISGIELAVSGDLTIDNNSAAGIEFSGEDITIETRADFQNNNVLG